MQDIRLYTHRRSDRTSQLFDQRRHIYAYKNRILRSRQINGFGDDQGKHP
jgi:hypothetical protein